MLCRDGCDDDHAADFAVRALVHVEAGHAQAEGFDGFGFTRWNGGRVIERGACLREFLALGAIGDEAVVANAHEAGG